MDQQDADYADSDSRRFPLGFWSLLAIAAVVAILSAAALKIVFAPVKENI